MSQSNLLARLAAVINHQQQQHQRRDLTVEDDEDDDTRHTMTDEGLEAAQRRLNGGSGRVLDTCDLVGIAKYIKAGTGYGSGKRKIVVMAGVGISTSAGIPDFRSPKIGLYNIDTLERLAGVPPEKLVEAHGSFADNHCVDYGAEFPSDEMRKLVMTRNPVAPGGVNVPRCKDTKCGRLVKPNIVFFGESLPEKFHNAPHMLPFADLALVIGTSLTVHPFARLPEMVHLAPCDDAVRELCDLLGWHEDLEKTWAKTGGLVVGPSSSVSPALPPVPEPSRVETVKSAMGDRLAQLMGNKLNLSTGENAEAVAAAVAENTQSQPTSNTGKATASIRVSLAWVPEPAPIPDEGSVLVLTAPTGHYVDIHIKLPPTKSPTTSQLSETPTNDPSQIPPNSTLSWGFAGIAS
ncbi:Sir2 histone deacetylase Hst2 [Ceratobasidium sp. 423]|nr:Sir2 histone deacetylase Hst2 [Ceratobasidium sp. 423]